MARRNRVWSGRFGRLRYGMIPVRCGRWSGAVWQVRFVRFGSGHVWWRHGMAGAVRRNMARSLSGKAGFGRFGLFDLGALRWWRFSVRFGRCGMVWFGSARYGLAGMVRFEVEERDGKKFQRCLRRKRK